MLTQRRLPGQDAAYLSLLLTCFIELDPAPDMFADLLARYAADRAARHRRGRRGSSNAPGAANTAGSPIRAGPPLQETLRTLGGLLDDAGVQIACVAVEAQQTRVETFGEVGSVASPPASCAARSPAAWRAAVRCPPAIPPPPPA